MHKKFEDKNISEYVRDQLLYSPLHYSSPSITVDNTKYRSNEIDSTFFEFIPHSSQLFDIVLGRVCGYTKKTTIRILL